MLLDAQTVSSLHAEFAVAYPFVPDYQIEDAISSAVQQWFERTLLARAAPVEHPIAWLRTVAQRSLWKELSRSRRLLMFDQLGDAEQPTVRDLETAEVTRGVNAFLAMLTQEERELLYAHKIEGRSFEELAIRLRKPAGTLRSMASRALAKIRRQLPAIEWETWGGGTKSDLKKQAKKGKQEKD